MSNEIITLPKLYLFIEQFVGLIFLNLGVCIIITLIKKQYLNILCLISKIKICKNL